MSDPRRVLVLGASGLVGQQVLALAVGRPEVRLVAVARSEVALPPGARMEVLVAPPEGWDRAIATVGATHVICALGTTIRQQGGDKDAFAAIDRDLVLRAAMHARGAGATGFAVVSSVGATLASRNFYLRTKGEMEAGLEKIGFTRLDVLRPGLLRGHRPGHLRPLELLGQLAAPLGNMVLHGERRQYRAIRAADVAAAALQCTQEKAPGRFVHDHDSLHRLAGRWRRAGEGER
ncbi:NAD(P)H-binding protein [Alteraurantiacibacter buctensis]|uniref:NAD(P)H-binding protein n=1 Tax=Alteraurantiacibacter buctensis TaxID=1503981 RepID=A0A844YWA0_9SPHN|nr:NAD(P)H-binding protein [Alteraurantiacibacter buctensis]MXO72605.1 NAD(P)H-binding protein [Alteraurantiacibacter buctensis]